MSCFVDWDTNRRRRRCCENGCENPENKKTQADRADTFVLLSQCEHDGNCDVAALGTFSDWSALVTKAKSVMEQKPIHYYFEFAMECGFKIEIDANKIPKEPHAQHLKHAIPIASANEWNDNTSFTLLAHVLAQRV